jgi:hypothetical protein
VIDHCAVMPPTPARRSGNHNLRRNRNLVLLLPVHVLDELERLHDQRARRQRE